MFRIFLGPTAVPDNCDRGPQKYVNLIPKNFCRRLFKPHFYPYLWFFHLADFFYLIVLKSTPSPPWKAKPWRILFFILKGAFWVFVRQPATSSDTDFPKC